MNDPYFFCLDCKAFVPAGYRWAYAHLEASAGIARDAPVCATRILAIEPYWSAEEPRLVAELRDARAFLVKHESHRMRYGEFEFLFRNQGEDWADWLSESSTDDELLPRYFIERECCRSWSELAARNEAMPEAPWWWTEPNSQAHVRRRFDELLK